MINKVNILLYYFITYMKKVIRGRHTYIINNKLHKELKVCASSNEIEMGRIVEAGLKLVVEKSKVEIQKILELA